MNHWDDSGEKNPAWKGGIAYLPYCPKFNFALKERIREKYGRKCLICGKAEGDEHLCIHHVDYDKAQGCGERRWKLVPLCRSCHSRTNRNRDKWQTKIMQKIGGDDGS
jgi:hypothetical protein